MNEETRKEIVDDLNLTMRTIGAISEKLDRVDQEFIRRLIETAYNRLFLARSELEE